MKGLKDQCADEMIAEALHRYLPKNTPLAVALSGGRDSVCLLHAILQLQAQNPEIGPIRALHVQHTDHPIEAYWAEFCSRIAQTMRVPCKLLHPAPSADQSTKGGLEAKERALRYQAIIQALAPDEVLVTGHYESDQAETVLLHLKNGSGPEGLSAMRVVGSLGARGLVRPLLSIPDRELELYFLKHQLQCIVDPTNYRFFSDRNFLRHQILKPCQERWPSFVRGLARAARCCQAESLLLETLFRPVVQSAARPSQGLAIPNLRQQVAEGRWYLLRSWLKSVNAWPVRTWQLEAIWAQCICGSEGNRARIRVGQYTIQRHKDALYAFENVGLECQTFAKELEEIAKPLQMLPKGWGQLQWRPCPQNTTNRLLVVAPLNGYLGEPFKGHPRRRKAFCQRYQLAPWLREKIPHFVDAAGTVVLPFQPIALRSDPHLLGSWVWLAPGLCEA